MRKLLFLALLISSNLCYGQIWSETFDEAVGANSGTGSPSGAWTTTCVGCNTPSFLNTSSVFEVGIAGGYYSAGRLGLGGTGMNAVGIWTSPLISISGFTDIKIYVETGSLATEAGDYLEVYYNLDGAGEMLFHTATNGTVTSTGISPALNGTQVQIIFKSTTNAVNEGFTFDNISVTNTLFSRATAAWGTSGTWSAVAIGGSDCTCTPNQFNDVVVGGGNTVTIGAAAAAASLLVNGTTDLGGAGTLTYSGNFALDISRAGTLIVNTGGQITSGGNASAALSFTDNQSHTITNNGTISIGDLTITNSSIFTPTVITIGGSSPFAITDALSMSESSAQSVTLTSNVLMTIGGVATINNTSTFTNNSTVTMSGTAAGTLTGSGTWTQGINSTLNYAGSTITITTFNASNTGNTVNYNRVGIQTIFNPAASTYYNLSLSGSPGANTKSSSGNHIISGSLSISGTATLDVNAGTDDITVGGNWTVTSTAADPFVQGTRTVTFNGTGTQTISTVLAAGETFNNLTLNKASNRLVLSTSPSTDVTITGTMTFTAGIMTTTTAESLIFNSGSAVGGGTSTSYVDGPVKKFGNTNFTFPTGYGVYWARIGIGTFTGGNAATQFTAQYRSLAFGDQTVSGLLRVSTGEYWEMPLTAGAFTSAAVTLFWESGTRSGITSATTANLRVARYNGTDWVDTGVGSVTGTATTGTRTSPVITTANFGSYFTFGSNVALPTNPLPIELIDFNTRLKNDRVELDWSTASELNNDFFTIERASDIEVFEEVTTVKGQGTINSKTNYSSVDENPLPGISFYRLKQTDFDGKFTYSEVRKVEITDIKTNFRVYPNPVIDNKFSLELSGVAPWQEVPVRIMNMQGGSVLEANYLADQHGRVKATVELDHVSSGIYMVIVNAATGLRTKIVIP